MATSAFSINLLSAARVGPLRAAATPLRVIRSQGVAEVQVHGTGKDNRLVAMALVTVSFLAGEAFERRTRRERSGGRRLGSPCGARIWAMIPLPEAAPGGTLDDPG